MGSLPVPLISDTEVDFSSIDEYAGCDIPKLHDKIEKLEYDIEKIAQKMAKLSTKGKVNFSEE